MSARREGRGGDAPPRTPIRRKAAAALVLASVLTTATLAAGRTRPEAGPAFTTPFRPVVAIGRDASGAPASVPGPGDRLLLYVSDTCPYCATELDTWRLERLRPRVIVSPRSDSRDPDWLPTRLRAGRVHDVDGHIARALGVRAVPFTAVLDEAGTVVEAWAGPTGADRRARLEVLLTPDSSDAP